MHCSGCSLFRVKSFARSAQQVGMTLALSVAVEAWQGGRGEGGGREEGREGGREGGRKRGREEGEREEGEREGRVNRREGGRKGGGKERGREGEKEKGEGEGGNERVREGKESVTRGRGKRAEAVATFHDQLEHVMNQLRELVLDQLLQMMSVSLHMAEVEEEDNGCMYMSAYQRLDHLKQGKVTQQRQLRWLTFSSFQRKRELPQVGFEPTSLFL